MNALVTVPTANAEVYRASTDAAGLCGEIVKATARDIQGRRYVQVEGWQAIAVAHGCAASARDVERVEGGVRAIGEVRRMSDGVVIAEAEGFVGEDEPTWFGGEITTRYGKKQLPKRPDYAIRAMAQTRAISRACRSAFAHVVVMIDRSLSTTPAEEVPHGGFEEAQFEERDAAAAMPEPTPQPVKSAYQARKDGDYERLTAGLRACTTQAEMEAWAAKEKDALGALPHNWQRNVREEYGQQLATVKQAAAEAAAASDPHRLPPPESVDPQAWIDWVEALDTRLGEADSADELQAIQKANAAGITQANGIVAGAMERLAETVERRTAEMLEPA